MINVHASEDLAERYAKPEHAVVVDAPVKRTARAGGIHKGSRKAVIARARRENPQYSGAAAVEIFYGTEHSQDTVVIFDPSKDVLYGF